MAPCRSSSVFPELIARLEAIAFRFQAIAKPGLESLDPKGNCGKELSFAHLGVGRER